jgi:hypothetical protein
VSLQHRGKDLDKNLLSSDGSAIMKKTKLPKDEHFAGKHTKTLLVNRLSGLRHIRHKAYAQAGKPCPDVYQLLR